MTKQPWNIKQLAEAHKADLQACRTKSERSCAEGFYTIELRKAAKYWGAQRKLTPGEIAILSANCIDANGN